MTATRTATRIATIEAELDRIANKLRVGAAAGGVHIEIPPEHCVRLARRIERGGRPAQLLVLPTYDVPATADLRRWTMALATIQMIDPARDLALWPAAAL